MRRIRFFAIVLLAKLCLFSGLAYAVVAGRQEGIGAVAKNMMDPVTLFSDMVYTGCIVIGGSFLFASVVKYFEHRRSPLMVSMSTVVFLVIAGLLLLLLPFLSYIDSNAVQYTFFKK